MDKATYGEYVKSLNSPQYMQGLETPCQHSKYRITHRNRERTCISSPGETYSSQQTDSIFSPVYNFHLYLFCKTVYNKTESLLLTSASHRLRVKGHLFHKGCVNMARCEIVIIVQSIIAQGNLSSQQHWQKLAGQQMPCVFS